MPYGDSRDIAFKIAQSLLVVSATGLSILMALVASHSAAYLGKPVAFLGFLYFSFSLTLFSSFSYLISDFLGFQNWIKRFIFIYSWLTFSISFILLSLIMLPFQESFLIKYVYDFLFIVLGPHNPYKYALAAILVVSLIIVFFIGYLSKGYIFKIERRKKNLK